MARRIGYSGRYYLPPGYYDADWSYYTPKKKGKAYKVNIRNWNGKFRPGMYPASFAFINAVENWRLRGKYYDDYYKNTGKRPRYYNKVLRKKVKW